MSAEKDENLKNLEELMARFPAAVFLHHWLNEAQAAAQMVRTDTERRSPAHLGPRFLLRGHSRDDLMPPGCPLCPTNDGMVFGKPGARYSPNVKRFKRIGGEEASAVALSWVHWRTRKIIFKEFGYKPGRDIQDPDRLDAVQGMAIFPETIQYLSGVDDSPYIAAIFHRLGWPAYRNGAMEMIARVLFPIRLNRKTALQRGMADTAKAWRSLSDQNIWLREPKTPSEYFIRGADLKNGLDCLRHWLLFGDRPRESQRDTAFCAALWLYPSGLHKHKTGFTLVREIARSVYLACPDHQARVDSIFGTSNRQSKDAASRDSEKVGPEIKGFEANDGDGVLDELDKKDKLSLVKLLMAEPFGEDQLTPLRINHGIGNERAKELRTIFERLGKRALGRAIERFGR